jgi:hypothetical protein
MKMTELSNYYLYIDSDGKEHRSMVKPRDTRCLRVEILHTNESEIVERTYTFDDRDGKSVQPPSGLSEDRWTIDDHGPADPGSTPWIRVRRI